MAFTIFDATNITGVATATSFVKTGGTSSQFLMADGSTSTGGGGGIAGGITATQVAFGATTTDEIAGSAEATFLESVGKTMLQVGSTGGKDQTLININQANNNTSRARLELSKNTLTRGFLGIENASTDVTLYSNYNLVLDSDGNDVIITTQTASNVGVGNTSPTEKLDVTGRIKASKGVQVGIEADGDAAAGLVGTIRYREVNTAGVPGTRYSYTDMCMRTDTSTYEWVNIVTNRW